jgi:hypothetical protein
MSADQISLSVEELDAIREEARSEGFAAGRAEAEKPGGSSAFSDEEFIAVREEYDQRIRMLQLELERARTENEQLRASDPGIQNVASEILRLAYGLDQTVSKRSPTEQPRLHAVGRR